MDNTTAPAPCPLCQRPMTMPVKRHTPTPRMLGLMPTSDHIMPRHKGGVRSFGGDVAGCPAIVNRRIICRRCNEARGQIGHCPAVVACALAVMGRDASVSQIVWWQRHGRIAGDRYRAVQIAAKETA